MYSPGDKVSLVKKEIRVGNILVRAKAIGVISRMADLSDRVETTSTFFVEFPLSNHMFIGCMLYHVDIKPVLARTKKND